MQQVKSTTQIILSNSVHRSTTSNALSRHVEYCCPHLGQWGWAVTKSVRKARRHQCHLSSQALYHVGPQRERVLAFPTPPITFLTRDCDAGLLHKAEPTFWPAGLWVIIKADVPAFCLFNLRIPVFQMFLLTLTFVPLKNMKTLVAKDTTPSKSSPHQCRSCFSLVLYLPPDWLSPIREE